MNSTTFIAELKEVKQSKKNLDNVYRVVFETNDPNILDLGKNDAQTAYSVAVIKVPNSGEARTESYD